VFAAFGPEKATDMAFVAYDFSESLQIADSQFSLTFTADADEDGLTWFDKIAIFDLVKISELGKQKFVGIVTNRRYSSKVTDDSVDRTISISGTSVGDLLSRYKLILDTFLYDSDTFAEVENVKLKAALTAKMDSGLPIAPILENIYTSFFTLALKMGTINRAGAGTKALLDYFVDFGSDISTDLVMKYPIAISLYNPGENNIWAILANIVVPPINELFPRFNTSDGKYHVVFRQAPFDGDDWRKLPLNKVPALITTSCDFGSNDAEIYTYYLATIAGSPIGEPKAMLMDAEGYAKTAERDEEKWKRYGYRPMIVEFKYFDKDYYESSADLATIMRSLAVMLRTWFEHNDEFLSGSIEFMTTDISWVDEPRIGGRLKFLEGEFYIEKSEHSWSYGGTMTTRLGLSRGYVYNSVGAMVEPIPNPGRKWAAIVDRDIETKEVSQQMFTKRN